MAIMKQITDKKRFGGGTGKILGLVFFLSLFTNNTSIGLVSDLR